jgi:hypothetical protein
VPPDTTIGWGEVMRRKHRRGQQPFRAIETDLVDGRWLIVTESTPPGGSKRRLPAATTNA